MLAILTLAFVDRAITRKAACRSGDKRRVYERERPRGGRSYSLFLNRTKLLNRKKFMKIFSRIVCVCFLFFARNCSLFSFDFSFLFFFFSFLEHSCRLFYFDHCNIFLLFRLMRGRRRKIFFFNRKG